MNIGQNWIQRIEQKTEENWLDKIKKWKILKTGQKLIGKIERNWKILNNLKYYIQVC